MFSQTKESIERIFAARKGLEDPESLILRKLVDMEKELRSLRVECKSLRELVAHNQNSATRSRPQSNAAPDIEDIYVDFEEDLRGSEDKVRKRLLGYLDLYQAAELDFREHVSVDVGCGRGEWLMLLKEHGYSCIGVDSNAAMLEEARAKDLTVTHGDALKFLSEQKDSSLACVSAFHIVEHLPTKQLLKLFQESYRTLKKGGFILFETPNPETLMVGACSFYGDPTHLRPLPPTTLQFYAKKFGFSEINIRKSEPIRANFQSTDPELRALLEQVYGPQDYAIIAKK